MRALLLCGCASLLVAPPASTMTYHVAPDSSGDVLNIQAAIDAATSGDEIVLADGIFTGDGNWDLNFGAKELVLRSANGYEATTIHCGFDGIHAIQHRGVILEGGQTSATRIEGITFRRSFGDIDGGSIRCIGVSPVIRSVHIYDNRMWGRGGGIFVQGGSPVIEDCVFGANYTSYIVSEGEAIYSRQAWLTVQRCSFAGIHSVDGAVSLDGGTVEDCTFESNLGPGDNLSTCLHTEGQVSILRCTFQHMFGSSVTASGEVLIDGCRFEWNSSDDAAGIRTGGDATIRNSVFLRNSVAFTGSAINSSSGTVSLDHCVFAQNGNDAIAVGGTTALNVTRCTFVGNGTHVYSPPERPGSSIALRWGSPRVTIDRTIIAFGWELGSTAVNCQVTPAELVVTCSDVFGNPGGDWVGCLVGMETANGNLWADPLFCDVAGGDFGLQADSPCAPANSGECGLIGALEVACGPTAVEGRSWGSIKALYR